MTVRYKDRSIPAKNKLYGNYKYVAKTKNRVFELSKEDFIDITSSNCFYCNNPPSKVIKENKKGYNVSIYVYNGIDRINSLKGYFKENCVPCCHACNFSKNDMPYADFFKWLEVLTTNLRKSSNILIQNAFQKLNIR